MNKKKVIDLINLVKDESFVSYLEEIGNINDIEESIDYTRVLNLNDEEIDNILNTENIKLKAYKFYITFCDKRYKPYQRKELVSCLKEYDLPYFILDYLISLVNNNTYYRMDSVIEMVKKVLSDEDFKYDIFEVLNNHNINKNNLPRILESFTFSNGSFNNLLMNEALKNKAFVNHHDVSNILEVLSKEENNDKALKMYGLLLYEGIVKDVSNLSYIMGLLSKTDEAKFDIACKLLKNSSIQKLYSTRTVIESIVDSLSVSNASVVGIVSLNEELQDKDCYYDVLKILKLSQGVVQALNGQKAIEYLQDEDMIDKVSVNKIVNGVTRSKDAKISDNAISALKNKRLQGNKNYEDIVYSIGTSSDGDLSNNGLDLICRNEFINHPKLLKMVNFITSGIRNCECANNAYKLTLDEDLASHDKIDSMIESIASSKDVVQSKLALDFACFSTNKKLKDLDYIVRLIASCDALEKSKIIYALGFNPDVIRLKKEGIAIMEEIYNANDMKEVDYILNTKYNINNLEDFIRLSEVLKKDSDLIIEALNYLDDEDIDKNTIIKRKIKCKK